MFVRCFASRLEEWAARFPCSGRAAALLLVALGVSACVTAAERGPANHFVKYSLSAPTVSRVFVCHGFECFRRTAVDLNATDIARLRQIMAAGKASPEAERAALSKAVVWFDKRSGPIVGTDRDIGGLDMQNARVVGQQDCIDEATTTAGFLVLLDKNGLLTHYRPGNTVARGFLFDGRYPHATATIVPREGGDAYAIDPWPYDHGERPDIIPLSQWMASRGGARES